MSKIINTILLSTTLILCSQGYTSTIVYDPIRNLLDNGYKLNDCVVEEDDGKIYYCDNNSNKQYLVDDENCYFYSYETIASKNSEIGEKVNLILLSNGGIWSQNTCFDQTKNIKSIIIPEGSRLESANGGSVVLDAGRDSTVLCLGTFEHKANDAFFKLKQAGYGNTTFIFGPHSVINCSGDNECNPIVIDEETKQLQNLKLVFFPGSQIKNKTDVAKTAEVIPQSQVILNRYVEKTEKLDTKINQDANVLFPEGTKLKHTNNCDVTLAEDIFGNKLQWSTVGGDTERTDANDIGIGNGQYNYKNPDLQLAYIINNDTEDEIRNGKSILGINRNNEFAKYDVALWNQCKIDNENYGVARYNTEENKSNYIDTDNLEKLFYGNPSEITLHTNTIHPGLIGSKNITLDLSSVSDDNDESSKVYFYGNNTKYSGVITIKQKENKPVTSMYYGKDSIINNIKLVDNYNGILNLNNITHYLLEDNTIDLAMLHCTNSIFTDKRQILQKFNTDNSDLKLTIVDTSEEKHKQVFFMNKDYSEYKGKIIIPEDIETVFVACGDLFSKIQYASNSKDISELEYHLLRNVSVDISNIQIFNMSINNESIGIGLDIMDNDSENDIDIKTGHYRIVITNNENNSQYDTITFNGNNTNYRDIYGNENKGIVKLCAGIKNVIFNDKDSFVVLEAASTSRMLTENNVISSSEEELPKVINTDYDQNDIQMSNNNGISSPVNVGTLKEFLDKYNLSTWTWDIDKMENFVYGSDNKRLLMNLTTPVLSANLSGNHDIKLTTSAQLVNISGDNSNYGGTITIPNNIQAVVYKNNKSKVKLSRNNIPIFQYDNQSSSVQDNEYDEQHIQDATILRAGKQIQKIENNVTSPNNLKSNVELANKVKNNNVQKTDSQIIKELLSKHQERFNNITDSNLQMSQQNNNNKPINTGKATLKKNTKTVLRAQTEKAQNKLVTFDESLNAKNNGVFSSISNMLEKLKSKKNYNSILKNTSRSINKNNIKQNLQNEEENIGSESGSEEESVQVGENYIFEK